MVILELSYIGLFGKIEGKKMLAKYALQCFNYKEQMIIKWDIGFYDKRNKIISDISKF